MGAALCLAANQCLSLGPLAPFDLERRAQVGKGVAGAELTARLVEMEPDDWKEWQRGDRGEEHDVRRSGRPLPRQPNGKVDEGKGAGHSGPRHIRNEEWIPRAEPRAQRGRQY